MEYIICSTPSELARCRAEANKQFGAVRVGAQSAAQGIAVTVSGIPRDGWNEPAFAAVESARNAK